MKAIWVVVALVYGILSLRAIPLWDGAFYYAYLRSAVIDGDWDLSNDIRLVGERSGDPYFGTLGMDQARTPTGRIRNTFPIGSALLWLPYYLVVHAGVWLVAGPARADGFTFPYIWTISALGAVFMLAGMTLTYLTCRRRFSAYAAALGVIVAWLASPLLHYGLREPAYSHVASAGLISLFLWVWWQDVREQPSQVLPAASISGWSAERAIGLGAILGVAALIRWQNILFLILPAVDLLYCWWSDNRRRWRALGLLALMAATALILFTPQMATWKIFYGSFFTVPQNLDFREMKGSGFMHWLSPAVGKVLFSSFHGLFTWQPAAFLGLIGLGFIWKGNCRRVSLAFLGIALQVYIVASAGDWFGGNGFGPRRLDSLTPFLALGLAVLANWARRRWQRWLLAAVGLLLIAATWTLMMVAWPAGAGGTTDIHLNLEESGLARFYSQWWAASLRALSEPWRLIVRDAPFYRIVNGVTRGSAAQIGIGLAAWSAPALVALVGVAVARLIRRLWRILPRPANLWIAAGSVFSAVICLNWLILTRL